MVTHAFDLSTWGRGRDRQISVSSRPLAAEGQQLLLLLRSLSRSAPQRLVNDPVFLLKKKKGESMHL